jgi:hypothetical protein
MAGAWLNGGSSRGLLSGENPGGPLVPPLWACSAAKEERTEEKS